MRGSSASNQIVPNNNVDSQQQLSERGTTPYTDEALTSKDSGGMIYTYDYFVNQPDMKVIQLPQYTEIQRNNEINPDTVLQLARENVMRDGLGQDIGNESVATTNAYSGRVIAITGSGIRHSLKGDPGRLLRNSKAASVIGDIARNALSINALKNTSQNAKGQYAMAAYLEDATGNPFIAILTIDVRTNGVNGLNVYDVSHSLNMRNKHKDGSPWAKTPQARAQSQVTFNTSVATSIKDLLDVVNGTFRSILSSDVTETLGGKKDPSGYYYDRTLFSERDPNALPSARGILAGAFGEVAKTPAELKRLEAYRGQIDRLNQMEQTLKEKRLELKALNRSRTQSPEDKNP